MRNLHKYYYKDYFDGINLNDINCKNNQNAIKSKNSELLSSKLYEIPNEMMTHSFSYIVAYPGLITGVGIRHEMSIQGEFKLGMHFDYTYGMPVVYGSSVKGVLSSYFEEVFKAEFQTSYPEIDAKVLREAIFEGNCDGNPISIYKRDIFFDAVIIEEDETKPILVSDSITPHTEGPLKDPTPLAFMKIAPGCTMEFRFLLRDSFIPAAKKLEIFKRIIELVGVGAKTNVGYGQFEVKKK